MYTDVHTCKAHTVVHVNGLRITMLLDNNNVRWPTRTAGSGSLGVKHILLFAVGTAAAPSTRRDRLNEGRRWTPLSDRLGGGRRRTLLSDRLGGGRRWTPLSGRLGGGRRRLSRLSDWLTAVTASIVITCPSISLHSLRRLTISLSWCALQFGILTSNSIVLLWIDTS